MRKALYALPIAYAVATPTFAQGLTEEQQGKCNEYAESLSSDFEELSQMFRDTSRKFLNEMVAGKATLEFVGDGKTSITFYFPEDSLKGIEGCVIKEVNRKGHGNYQMKKEKEKFYTIKTLTGPII